MAVHGHKPAANFVRGDDGVRAKFEGEQRQCIHCQFLWDYIPGSGAVRGYCLNCDGFMCGRDECLLEQKRLTDLFLHQTGKVRNCIPFDEWYSRVQEKVAKVLPLEPGLTVTESGLIVPK